DALIIRLGWNRGWEREDLANLFGHARANSLHENRGKVGKKIRENNNSSLESAAPYVPPVGTLTSKPRTPESALQTSSSALHVSKYDIKDDEDDDCLETASAP